MSWISKSPMLLADPLVCAYFEELSKELGDKGIGGSKLASNWVINDVLAAMNARKQTLSNFPVRPAALIFFPLVKCCM